MTGITARRYWIGGRVQGVGFRYFAQRAAERLVVSGWARNLADGRVEVHGQGAAKALEDFEALLRTGPPRSEVRTFEVKEGAPEAGESFRIR
jgi:acylphosphatase